MGIYQDVSNWLSGTYKVRTTKLSDNAQLQHVRIDVGTGTTESQLSSSNGLPVTQTSYAVRLDEASATVSYVGEAEAGSSAASAVWRIKKIDESSGTVITWADGSTAFDQVWDDRASLTYS